MSAIFESNTLGPTERLVMLALADHADDDGRCYPSIQRLCQRTGLSERAVQTNIRKLVDQGYIRTIPGGGKGNANLYFVSANPAADAPRTKCTPAADAPQTPQEMRVNPAADAPEPSGTIIEPSRGGEEGVRATADVDKPCRAPSLVAQLAEALGFNDPNGTGWPRYWVAADAPIIASRWITDLGLSEAEIVEVAVANMRQHGSPANGPKTLIRHMQAFAAAKNAPPLEIPAQPTGGPTYDRATARDRRQAAADEALRARLYAAARVD